MNTRSREKPFVCPACGMPQKGEVQECPDCGVIVAKFMAKHRADGEPTSSSANKLDPFDPGLFPKEGSSFGSSRLSRWAGRYGGIERGFQSWHATRQKIGLVVVAIFVLLFYCFLRFYGPVR